MIELPLDSKGKLAKFAWPGGYPIYYITRKILVLCNDCASLPNDDDSVFTYDIHWEGESIFCDDCNEEIESAYGHE